MAKRGNDIITSDSLHGAVLIRPKIKQAGDSAIEKIASQTFGSIRLEVGGKHFDSCKFSGTTLVYSGGKCPRFTGSCEFDGAGFDFTGEGWEAFAWLRTLRAMTNPDFIETLLEIKKSNKDGTAH